MPAAARSSAVVDSRRTDRTGIVSVGYESRQIDEFVLDLARRDVSVVVDVRLNAVSRRPGFSKSALRAALTQAGIDYVHLRGLGNPRDIRPLFGGDDVELGREAFRAVLNSDAAAHDLDRLQQLRADGVVAILCFERDEQRCHRQVVIDTLLSREQAATGASGRYR